MKNKIIFWLILAAAQLAVPLWMIAAREWTLHRGERLLFKVEPVDPYDAFRGRYVTLGIQEDRWMHPAASNFIQGQTVFVSFTNNADGFAVVKKVDAVPGKSVSVKAQVGYLVKGSSLSLNYPFNAFYLDEVLAPEAEKAMRRNWDPDQSESTKAHIAVRIWRGQSVIENLYLNNLPVVDYLNKLRSGNNKKNVQGK